MSDLIEFKCPTCGGRMEFDSTIQKMKCPFCNAEIEINSFNETQTAFQEEGVEFKNACSGEWQDNEIKGMRVYSCKSCGGEIIAEETAGTSYCPYCRNKVVIKSQFSGGLKPDMIIPFKHNKKYAKEAYLSLLKNKPFLPKVFKEENHIDEINGIYVPFWIFDADVDIDFLFQAEKISSWTIGDRKYIETKYYNVERGGTISFNSIPTDASKKIDDTLMESIEPYKIEEAVQFNCAYLSGYLADRYDVEANDRFDRAKERIHSSAIETCISTINQYSNISIKSENVKIINSQYRYAMFPVWILNTTWAGKKYTFAMNGQTGKMVGDLPIDIGAFIKYVLIQGLIIAAIIYAIMWLIVLLP